MNIIFKCECGNTEVKKLMDNDLEQFEIIDIINGFNGEESYLKCKVCNKEERY